MSQRKCSAPLLENAREAFESAQIAWILSTDEKSISRRLVAKNWSAALAFINQVSEIAEEMNHHPDIHLTNYREVELILSTHAASGLTNLDIDMALRIDKIPVEYSPKWLREEKAIAEYQEIEENEVPYSKEHYGKGLNGDFISGDSTDILANFRGDSEDGGGGKFENPELRDIAASRDDIIQALHTHAGLRPGAIVADIGAGTGLLTPALAAAVRPNNGTVIATDISSIFLSALRERLNRLNVSNVILSQATDKDPGLDDVATLDIALLVDVYHHFLFPRTILTKVRSKLSRNAALVIIDFHRDPKRVKSQGPDWPLQHIRADQATFTKEIVSTGFTLVKELDLPGLPENYFLIFKKRPLPTTGDPTPGVGWTTN